MKNILKFSLLALALALSTATKAHADGLLGWLLDPPSPSQDNNNCAPEIDAGLAVSAVTLLGGTLTVMRARRRRQ